MKRKLLVLLTAAASVLAFAPKAHATSYDLDFVFSGSTPNSSSPYLTMNFVQSGANVTLTVTGSLENSSEFISDIYFNSTNATGAVTNVSCTTCVVSTPIAPYSSNAYTADGGGAYDFNIQFSQANANRFNGTDVAVFTIANAQVSWFDVLASPSGGNGVYFVAAHLQGINTTCSGWISDGNGASGVGAGGTGPCGTVPDSGSTVALLGLAMLGVGYARRRFL